MSKFNETNTIKVSNKSGCIAYSMKDKEKLMTQVLSTFFNEPKNYGDNSNEIVETAKKVCVNDVRFVANLAIYARKEFNLRSISHVLVCLLSRINEGKKYVKEVMWHVVERPDDLTEILAYYLAMYGKPIPNSLKKGLAKNLTKFNEFQISKYNGGNKEVKFKDILLLTHAKPKDEKQSELFNKILNDNLATAIRWETEVSTKGNNKETWESLIENNQLGYMAMLRNLRNIIEANPKNINKVYEKLANKDEVLKSKQLPFRFYSAYKEISKLNNITNKPLNVLEKAIEYSIENMEKIPGKTAICIDYSGSMDMPISKKSKIKCNEIASILGIILNRICDESIIYLFDTKAYKVLLSKNDGILSSTKALCGDGGRTDISAPIKEMIKNNVEVDRIVVLSDNEANRQFRSSSLGFNYYTAESVADEYRKKLNKNVWIHTIDMQGYGTQQFCGPHTNLIAGWSEKVLDFILLVENGMDSLIKTINDYLIK